MNVRLALALASVLAASSASASEAITRKNWFSHPAIVEIRALFDDVEAGVKSGVLKHSKKEFDYERPSDDLTRELWTDENGVVRKFSNAGGSDDSATTRDFYYDPKGKLRFLYVRANAVNGTKMEYRVYFDESGKRIWDMSKLTAGPGYTFPQKWPKDDVVLDPKKAFAAPRQ